MIDEYGTKITKLLFFILSKIYTTNYNILICIPNNIVLKSIKKYLIIII